MLGPSHSKALKKDDTIIDQTWEEKMEKGENRAAGKGKTTIRALKKKKKIAHYQMCI